VQSKSYSSGHREIKFLFTTLPSNDLGLLTRSLPIATELAAQGHEVVFCSPGESPGKLIAEAGFDNLLPRHPLFYLMTTRLSVRGLFRVVQAGRRDFGGLFRFLTQLVRVVPTRFAPITSEIWNVDHQAAFGGMLNERLVRAGCEGYMALVKDCDADVVVDFWNPFACLAAKALRKPLVTVIQADMHPASKGFIWWKEPPSDLPTPVPVVNKVLAEYNLQPISQTGDLFAGDLTLVLGMPETDPLPEAADVIYVGPILWQKPGAKLPGWVDALSKEKPVIWVYSGNPRYVSGVRTPVVSAVVLQACIAALADEDVQVILTTGHHPLPKGVVPLPDNFHHEPFVPGLAMAERSDLLIHHGGYGSCQTGLYTGTPAVIIPTYSERESNARRIAAVGAGEFVVPVEGRWGKKRVRTEELRAKVRKVLADPTYAANARLMRERLRAFGGASESARLIGDFARGWDTRTEDRKEKRLYV